MKRLLVLGAAVLAPRLVLFPWNENLYGDAVARTWLADLWAASPHVIGSFDQGGFQYGPLHLYLVGLAGLLWPSPEHAGRLVSLAAGVATAWPLHVLTRRLFDARAADVAVLAFAAWGLHIQCSTTTVSETLNLLLVVGALALLQVWNDDARRDAMLGSALLLNLACATRYDSWLYVPLLGLAVFWRARRVGPALAFLAAASAFAVPWMFGNAVDRGDPLYPFTYINDFHRAWFPGEQQIWGTSTYRWMTLFFWPGAAVATVTPLVAVAGFAGLGWAWRRRPQARWLVALVVAPTVLYTVRSTVLESFAPLARFTLKEVALLLPFVAPGAAWLLSRARLQVRQALVALAAACAVAWPLWLGAYTFRTEGGWRDTLRPISPTSTNRPTLMRVADWLDEHAAPGGGVLVVDVDPHGYDDVQVSFFAGFPYEHGARLRSPYFEKRLASGRPTWLLRFDGGDFEKKGLATLEGRALVFRGMRFEEVDGQPAPFHVYRRAD